MSLYFSALSLRVFVLLCTLFFAGGKDRVSVGKSCLPPDSLGGIHFSSSPVSSFSEGGDDVLALIPYAGCLPIQEGVQILPKQSVLDLFRAQDNTLCISI